VSLKPGPIPPKDMDVRQYAKWCLEQDTTEANDVTAALAVHTASVDNTTQAELVAAFAAHTASTDNTTAAELASAIVDEAIARDAAIAAHTASSDNTTAAELAAALESGTYTPTLTNSLNLDTSTAYLCQYMRVGTTVTVSGRVDVDPTAGGDTQLLITLPVASNFGQAEDCGGVAFAPLVAGQGAGLWGDPGSNKALMRWVAVDTTNQPMAFSFAYRII